MNNFQYTFLYLLCLCCSCTTCQFDEIKTLATWDNGQIKTLRYIGNFGALEENYYADGQLASEGLVINDEKQQEWLYYYPNGQLKKKVFYRDNTPYGKIQTYYDNGHIQTEEEIDEMGHRIGEWKLYDQNGLLSKTEIYNSETYLEQNSYYPSIEKEWGMVDENTLVKPINQRSTNEEIELPVDLTFYSEKGQLIDQGKRYKDHSIYQWTFRYDNGQKRAEGQFLFADEDATETYTIDYPIRKEFSDVYYDVKIGKWTYWNKVGDKKAVIDYRLEGRQVKEKIIYWKGK